MRKLLTSLLCAFLLTAYGSSIYLLISLSLAVFQNGDFSVLIIEIFEGACIAFVFFTFIFLEINEALERMNRKGRHRDNDKQS